MFTRFACERRQQSDIPFGIVVQGLFLMRSAFFNDGEEKLYRDIEGKLNLLPGLPCSPVTLLWA